MEKSKNYSITALILVVFVLFLTGAFYLGRKSISPIEEEIVLTDEPVPEPMVVEVVDPNTGWKTYTSIDPEISVSYPNNWYYSQTGTHEFRIQNYDPASVLGRGYDPVVDKGRTFISFRVDRNLKAESISILKSMVLKDSPCNYYGDYAGDTITINSYTKKVGSIEYLYKKSYCSKTGVNSARSEIYIVNKGQEFKDVQVFELGFGLDQSVAEKEFEKIIETIKFN